MSEVFQGGPAPSAHLRFRRAGRWLAVAMTELVALAEVPSLRRLPGAEPSLAGFAVLRDVVLPVFDPALWFESVGHASVPGYALLFRSGDVMWAVLADEVGRVLSVPPAERAPPGPGHYAALLRAFSPTGCADEQVWVLTTEAVVRQWLLA